MARPLSQLIYQNVQAGEGGVPIITLHDHNSHAPTTAPWGIAASPQGKVVALESYKGLFVGREIEGYTWFMGPNHAPSPIFFGDALAEIERFLWDEFDRSGEAQPELPYLVGFGQGGIMAIATALAVPDLLSGVVAVNAFLPNVQGWAPPLAPVNRLPVLLVNPAESSSPQVLHGEELQSTLNNWDADADILWHDDAEPIGTGVQEWIATHGVRRLAPSNESEATSS